LNSLTVSVSHYWMNLDWPLVSSLLLLQYDSLLRVESESYVTTDGQSASLSWNKASIWGLRPDFYYCQTVAGLLIWGGVSDERACLSYTIAAGPRQRSHCQVRVPWDTRPYFTVSDLRLPFRRLLRLAGLRWRYSTPPPHRILSCKWITCPFMTRCGPQTEHIFERFVCCNLRTPCHGNACLPNRCPATVYSALPGECAQRSAAQQTVINRLSGVMSQHCITLHINSGVSDVQFNPK
jgi:hypothetical protein